MPRPTTFPDTVEECRVISISRLKEWGYLTDTGKSGSIYWTHLEKEVARIGINSFPHLDEPYIHISYSVTSRLTSEVNDSRV